MKSEISKIQAAIEAGQGKPVPAPGAVACCRVYVCVQAANSALVAKAAKGLGMIYQKKAHYGLSHVLYVGYDNAKGDVAAKGQGIVVALQGLGIPAYLELAGD